WMILARQVGQKPSDHAFLVVRGYDHTKPKRGRRWSGPPVAPSPEGGDRVVADEGEQGCLRKQEENPYHARSRLEPDHGFPRHRPATRIRCRRPGDAARDREARPHNQWARRPRPDRKSTRLNSSHVKISYAVFCLKKKKK